MGRFGVNWGQIFILDLAVFVSSTFRSLPTNVGLSSEVQKVSSSGGASPSTGLPPKRQGKIKNKRAVAQIMLAPII